MRRLGSSVRFVFVLAVLGGTLAPVKPAAARSYRFDQISVAVHVDAAGTMRIVEDRVVAFDGTYRGMFREIPKLPTDPRFGDYKVTVENLFDDGKKLARVSQEQLRPGTFIVQDRSDAVRLEWQYAATDQVKTFRLVYRIEGHVKRYRDIAELWWTFIEGDRGVPVNDAVVTVKFPAGAAVRAWGHGTLSGEVTIIDPSTVRFHVPGLRDDEELGGRIAFARDVVPKAPLVDETRLRTILLEEEAAAGSANAQRLQVKIWNIIPLLVALAWLFYFLKLFGRFGREHRVEAPKYLRELPAEYPPAIVGWLRSWGSVTPADMTATIMDLARRRFLTVTEVTREAGRIRKKQVPDTAIAATDRATSNLMPYERRVLQMLSNIAKDKGQVTSHSMREWATASPERMQKEMQEFDREVNAHGRSLNLIEDRAHTIVMSIAGSVGVGIACVLAFDRVLKGGRNPFEAGPLIVVALLIAIATLAMTPFLRQRSQVGAEHKERWEAFRRFLEDFSRLHEAGPGAIVLWDAYLVYAISLGVADKVIDAMRVHLPASALQNGAAFGWYYPMSAGGWANIGAFHESIGTLHQSLGVSATAAFATAPSGGDGGGGGFSGGGGGGGGGGSSGAY